MDQYKDISSDLTIDDLISRELVKNTGIKLRFENPTLERAVRDQLVESGLEDLGSISEHGVVILDQQPTREEVSNHAIIEVSQGKPNPFAFNTIPYKQVTDTPQGVLTFLKQLAGPTVSYEIGEELGVSVATALVKIQEYLTLSGRRQFGSTFERALETLTDGEPFTSRLDLIATVLESLIRKKKHFVKIVSAYDALSERFSIPYFETKLHGFMETAQEEQEKAYLTKWLESPALGTSESYALRLHLLKKTPDDLARFHHLCSIPYQLTGDTRQYRLKIAYANQPKLIESLEREARNTEAFRQTETTMAKSQGRGERTKSLGARHQRIHKSLRDEEGDVALVFPWYKGEPAIKQSMDLASEKSKNPKPDLEDRARRHAEDLAKRMGILSAITLTAAKDHPELLEKPHVQDAEETVEFYKSRFSARVVGDEESSSAYGVEFRGGLRELIENNEDFAELSAQIMEDMQPVFERIAALPSGATTDATQWNLITGDRATPVKVDLERFINLNELFDLAAALEPCQPLTLGDDDISYTKKGSTPKYKGNLLELGVVNMVQKCLLTYKEKQHSVSTGQGKGKADLWEPEFDDLTLAYHTVAALVNFHSFAAGIRMYNAHRTVNVPDEFGWVPKANIYVMHAALKNIPRNLGKIMEIAEPEERRKLRRLRKNMKDIYEQHFIPAFQDEYGANEFFISDVRMAETIEWIEKNLGAYDFHAHTFGHCHKNVKDNPWDGKDISIDDKLKNIEESLERNIQHAKDKGVVALALTEHPHDARYDVTNEQMYDMFRRAQERNPEIDLLYGIEVNVLRDSETGEYFIGLQHPSDDDIKKGIMKEDGDEVYERLKDLDLIVCSIHAQHYFYTGVEVETADDYFEICMSALNEMHRLKRRLRRDGKKTPVIFGHPWALPHRYNRWKHKTASEESKRKYSLPKEFDFFAPESIKFFSKEQTERLAGRMAQLGIILEINSGYINKGGSGDFIQKGSWKAPYDLTTAYIRACEALGRPALISPGSDSHNSKVGLINAKAIARCVDNITNAVVWYQSRDRDSVMV